MSIIPNQRLKRPALSQEDVSSSRGASQKHNLKRRWSNLIPFMVALVVVAEISFLGRLDMTKNAELFNSWADSFNEFIVSPLTHDGVVGGDESGLGDVDQSSEKSETCEQWLEREDSVTYSRDFEKDPIFVSGADQEWKSCSVGCKFGFDSDRKVDAAFGLRQPAGTASVFRSMESAQYYPENNIAMARRWEWV